MQLSPSGRQGCPPPRGGGNAPQAPFFDHNNNGPPPAHAWFHPNQNQAMSRFPQQQQQQQQQYNGGIPPPPPTANGRYAFNNYSGNWEWYPEVNFQPQQQNTNQLGGALSNFIQGFLIGQNNNNNNQQQQPQSMMYPQQYQQQQHPNNYYGYVPPVQENIFQAADYKGLPMVGNQNQRLGEYFSPSSSSPTVASRLLFANSESPFHHRRDAKIQNNNSKNNKSTSLLVAMMTSIFTIHSARVYVMLIRQITLACGTYLCVVGSAMIVRSDIWLLSLLPEVMRDWNRKENSAFAAAAAAAAAASSSSTSRMNNRRKEDTYFKEEGDTMKISSSSSSFLPFVFSSQIVGVAVLIIGALTVFGSGFGSVTKRSAFFLFSVGVFCLCFVMSDDFSRMSRNFNNQHQLDENSRNPSGKYFKSESNGFFYNSKNNNDDKGNTFQPTDDPTFPPRQSAASATTSTPNTFNERRRNTNVDLDDGDDNENDPNENRRKSRSRQEQKLSNDDIDKNSNDPSNSNEAQQRGYFSRFFSSFFSKLHDEGRKSDLDPFDDGGYLGRKKSFIQKLGTSLACYSGFQAWMLILCGISLCYLDFCARIAL